MYLNFWFFHKETNAHYMANVPWNRLIQSQIVEILEKIIMYARIYSSFSDNWVFAMESLFKLNKKFF